jgi:hypothetical protein
MTRVMPSKQARTLIAASERVPLVKTARRGQGEVGERTYTLGRCEDAAHLVSVGVAPIQRTKGPQADHLPLGDAKAAVLRQS